MGQDEPLGLRGESNLRGFFGGRMPGVARAIALFLAEGCFVNQQIGTLPGIHRRCAWPRVARECDEPAWPCNADEAIGRQLFAVSQLDWLTLGEFAPERTFWNSGGLGFLNVKASATHVLFEDISERWPAAVFGRKREDVVAVAFRGPGYRVPGNATATTSSRFRPNMAAGHRSD